jgi:DNA-binding NarL/FixJ family response regulator
MVVVGEAGNGAETVDGVSRTRPDLVLLDSSVPDLDGLEVFPMVRKQSPEIGIVVFSAFEAARMRRPTTELGAHRYMEKGEKGRPLDELRATTPDVAEAKRSGTLPPLHADGPNGDATGGRGLSPC